MKAQPILRPILWIGSSLGDLRDMPEDVKKEFGHSLRDIQKGRDPGNTKPLRHLGESGVLEIVVDDRAGTFRTVYTVEFKDAIAATCIPQEEQRRHRHSEEGDRFSVKEAKNCTDRLQSLERGIVNNSRLKAKALSSACSSDIPAVYFAS